MPWISGSFYDAQFTSNHEVIYVMNTVTQSFTAANNEVHTSEQSDKFAMIGSSRDEDCQSMFGWYTLNSSDLIINDVSSTSASEDFTN